MPARAVTQLASRLRREPSANGSAHDTDRDLLTRFLQEDDEAAFESLVRRHDRLVRSAIAKVLSDPHDAEDAFQATFLILVRRAKSIDWRAGIGPWLYGVAHRVAVKARDAARTRSRKELEAGAKPSEPEQSPDLSWREACALLHAELDKLPDRYRLPLLLCYLEGKTRDEAASALKVTAGTVKGRLERGREMLRERLARSGIALSAGLLAAVACGTAWASSPSGTSAVLEAVRGSASARVLTLTREAAVSTILSKLAKSVACVVGVAAVASALIATGAARPIDAPKQKEAPAAQPSAPPAAPAAPADKKDAPKDVPWVVDVVVHTPDGKPAANAVVSVWADRKKQVAGKTDDKGRLELSLPAFFPKVVVVATAPGFAPDWTEYLPGMLGKPLTGQPTKLTLREEGPALSGRVTDLEGRPVANLPVEVECVGKPKPGKTLDEHIGWNPPNRSRGVTSLFDLDSISAEAAGITTRVTTDKDGKFKITGVGKDRSVRITTRGETSEHFQVRVVTRDIDPKLEQHGPFGLHGSTFTIRIGPSRLVVGTVRDAKTGDPVPGMKIAELTGHICETTTDKDGKFRLVGLKKDARYMLGAGSLGESPYFDANILLDDTPGLDAITADIKVHRGTVVTGRVTDSAGKPVAGSIFYHWTRDNPHVKDYPGFQDSRVILSHWGHLDRDGRYKLLVIPGPGAVGVCASPEDAFPRVDLRKELDGLKVYAYPSDALHAVAPADFDPKNPKTLVHDFTLKSGKSRVLVIRGADGKLPEKLFAVGQTESHTPKLVAPDPLVPTGAAFVETAVGLRLIVESGVGTAEPARSYSLTITGLTEKRARAVILMDDAKTAGAVAAVTGDAETPVTVTLEKLGSLKGRVFDADGNPAAWAEVRVWLLLDRAKYDNLPDEVFTQSGVSGITSGAWQGFTSRTAKTDKDGKFELTGLLPGQKYRLVAGVNVEAKGGEVFHQQSGITVEPGKVLDLGDLKKK